MQRIPDAIVYWWDDWGGLVIIILVVGVVFTGLGWLTWKEIDTYRGECHNAGGHIISVRGEEICVDRDMRVIIL